MKKGIDGFSCLFKRHIYLICKLFEQLVEFATYQHSSNFAGSRTNFIELGVSQDTAGRVLVGISVATKTLDGIESNFCCALCRVKDGASAVLVTDLALITSACNRVYICTGCIQLGVHVSELALDQLSSCANSNRQDKYGNDIHTISYLEFSNRYTELVSFMDIGNSNIQCSLHQARCNKS